MLYPLQRALLVPVEAAAGARTWFEGLASATAGEDAARQALARQSERAMRVDLLQQENARLRSLLELRPGLSVRSQAAELLYEARRSLFAQGRSSTAASTHNVALGVAGDQRGRRARPGDAGLSAVVRGHPADRPRRRDSRAQHPQRRAQRRLRRSRRRRCWRCASWPATPTSRSATCSPRRASTASIRRACAVAAVQAVDRKVDSGFARIALTPAASPDGVRHVLILEPTGVQLPPRPEAAASEPAPAKGSKKAAKPAASRPGAQP